ncbi:hypothetical protein ISREJYDI_CDS0008 [Pseudomonas phage UNO-G1W1]|jgi:hypothetical protein|uniref:Uncharacterized protein n=1 Tax=Pseudomonas phage UNO-G1W1 TaxID=3136609 RepID=A0AAX4MVC4_9CAUD
MRLTIELKRSTKAKHGLLLLVTRKDQDKPFVYAKPFDMSHARAIKQRFEAWGKLGWPYEPKG